MERTVLLIMASLLAISVPLASAARPTQAVLREEGVGSLWYSWEFDVVLVAGDVMDMKWDPEEWSRLLEERQETFVRWEIYRGLSWEDMSVILSSPDPNLDFHRDEGLPLNEAFHYKLRVIYRDRWDTEGTYDAPDYHVYATGALEGTVCRDLALTAGDYSGSSVAIRDGATLVVAGDTTTGSIWVADGRLQMDNGTVNNVAQAASVTFGDTSEGTSGGGWIRNSRLFSTTVNCTLASQNIELVGNAFHGPGGVNTVDSSTILLQNNVGMSSVSLAGAGATVENNGITGLLDIYFAATVRHNVITGGMVRLFGEAQGRLERNTIQDGEGLRVSGGLDYPQLQIRHNCIRRNSVGMWVSDARPTKIDVNDNYWGHETGPYHFSLNPDGLGDEIIGDQLILEQWDPTDENCSDSPSRPYTLTVEVESEDLGPGETATVRVIARDADGNPAQGDRIEVQLDPPGSESGTLTPSEGLTDEEGVLEVTYVAPPAAAPIDEFELTHGGRAGVSSLIPDPSAPDASPVDLLQSTSICSTTIRAYNRTHASSASAGAPATCKLFGRVGRPVKTFWIKGKEDETRIYWLPRTTITLHELGADPSITGATVGDTGRFTLTLPTTFDFSKAYELWIKLETPEIKIFANPTAAQPMEVKSRALNWPARVFTSQNFVVDQDINPPVGDTGEAAVETYWFLWQQIRKVWPFVFGTTPLGYHMPIEVFLNQHGRAGGRNTYYCPVKGGTVCREASSIYLDRDEDSLPTDRSPHHVNYPSSLWHEFGHHVVREMYGRSAIWPGSSSVNHDGYANPYTDDSLDEGFASFWAAASYEILEKPGDQRGWYFQNQKPPTQTIPINFEVNTPMWDGRRKSPAEKPRISFEEHAVAGILWDLVDARKDTEASPDVKFVSPWGVSHFPLDDIDLDVAQVTDILRNHRPQSVADLFVSLKFELPTALTDPAQNPLQSGLSRLEEVFVMPRAFHDQNGDWRYQRGERVGFAANGADWLGGKHDAQKKIISISIGARPTRTNVCLIPGSTIEVQLEDQRGESVPEAFVHLDMDFDDGLESLDYQVDVLATSGKLYLQMPPDHYEVQASLSITGSTQPPLVISNELYWTSVPTDDHFLEHTFLVPRHPIFLPLVSLSPS